MAVQGLYVTLDITKNNVELDFCAALVRVRSKLDYAQRDVALTNAIDDTSSKSGGHRYRRLISLSVAMIFAAVAGLHAIPVLTEFVITGGENGATTGTFDGGGSGLVHI